MEKLKFRPPPPLKFDLKLQKYIKNVDVLMQDGHVMHLKPALCSLTRLPSDCFFTKEPQPAAEVVIVRIQRGRWWGGACHSRLLMQPPSLGIGVSVRVERWTYRRMVTGSAAVQDIEVVMADFPACIWAQPLCPPNRWRSGC